MKCIPTTGKVQPEGGDIDDTDIVDIMKDVGDTLQHIRVAQRVQMGDMAEMMNMSPDTLSRIERGTRMYRDIRQLYVITGLLGVRLSDVLRFSESCVMEGRGPWPPSGSNSPLVQAVLCTAPGSEYAIR
jgi:ribosome-binding protein aMBF1 (putative translation factor)